MEDSMVQQAGNEIDEQLQHIKGVVESLLFVNEKPVTLDQIKKVLETVGGPEIKKAIVSLQNEYEEKKSGMMIIEIAGGYQMLSNPTYASYLRNFYKTKHKEKLSKPALESMAIIAYKQPVTRSDIELIRGVNSDGVVAHLLDKELIKVVGRKDVPGRPYLYGTTKQFLEYFGLKSLDDLPALEEFPTLQPAAEGPVTKVDGEEAATEEASSESEIADAGEDLQNETEQSQEETTIVAGEGSEEKEELDVLEEINEGVAEEAREKALENEPEESAQKN